MEKKKQRISHKMLKQTASKVISWILIMAMLVTLPQSLPGMVLTAQAAEETEISTLVSDLVQVKAGSTVAAMNLYMNGVYETTAALEAGTTDVELQVNGETVKTVSVTTATAQNVIFRIREGQLLDSVNNAGEFYTSATLAGSVSAVPFVNDNGESLGLTEWNQADGNADLNYLGGGIYSRTFKINGLTADAAIKYKITTNHSWTVSFGDKGADKSATIPAGATSFTVWIDTISGTIEDSTSETVYPFPSNAGKTFSSVTGNVSLIGTIRGLGGDDWTEALTGYEFTKISDRYYLYQGDYAQGGYSYKVIFDHANWHDGSSNNITVAGDTHIVFLYDAVNEAYYDSVNHMNTIAEALGMAAAPIEAKVISNPNGTTRFVIPAGEKDTVKLVYGKNPNPAQTATPGEATPGEATPGEADAEVELKTVTLTKGTNSKGEFDGSFVSQDMFFGDEALDYVYYYLINDSKVLDSSAETVTVDDTEYSSYKRDEFKGRVVSVPGTLVNATGGATWDPTINIMTYEGNGRYSYTFTNVAKGNYQYKIAIDKAWDPENYGNKGVDHGDNIMVTAESDGDITVWYSDLSHYSVNSTSYSMADVSLTGTGIAAGTKFEDSLFTGIYSVTLSLAAGTYSDLQILYGEDEYDIGEFTLENAKDVTFYFDPSSEIYYSNASDVVIDTTNIVYDTQDTNFKSVYGAVEEGEHVTYAIETGEEITEVKMVVKGSTTEKGTFDLSKDGAASDGVQKWSIDKTFSTYGQYTYFFVIYQGSQITIYGDDDGYYGKGAATDLLSVTPYDQIVYKAGYETPDWMKDAVVYQIFPDRFFDGDTSNNTAQTNARGTTDYEYVTNWYLYPENPEQELIEDQDYPETAFSGDGNWSNEIYGGDLKGITERIEYLKALGVTVIYLNPVFASISSHRYDTSDYNMIDPILGTEGDFDELVSIAEDNGMHVVLDGVFNHVSDDSKYFDRYYEYLDKLKDSTDAVKAIGAYPYWAYVYDYMAENSVGMAAAESAAKTYFETEYGINNFDYTEWFDVFQSEAQYLKDDAGNAVTDTVGLRAGKPVYGYDGWWGYDSMPVVKSTNGSEYQTGTWAEEIIGTNESSTTSDGSVTQFWLDKGMDGWRLDVANEVSDETWQHFRNSVKALDKDNVIIGEIWTDAVQYLLGDMYDSVMNYMFRGAATSFALGGSSAESMKTLEKLRERYPEEAFYAMMNLVDSHDTTRILSYLDGIGDDRSQKDTASAFPTYEGTSDLAKARQYLVALTQFTYAGAPTIYYGDELGMVGADDPDDRRAMIWGQGNEALVTWYATLADIRSKYSALRTGTVETFEAVDNASSKASDALMSYVRRDAENALIVMMNNDTENAITSTVDVAAKNITAAQLTDLISGQTYNVDGGKVTVSVPSLSGVILVDSTKAVAISVDQDNLKVGYESEYVIADAKVTLNKTEADVEVGEVLTLTATGRDTITWASSDASVATVADGKVTTLKTGTVKITATQTDGQVAECTVRVVKAATGITLNQTTAALKKGETLTLQATVLPAGSTDSKLTWTSDKTSVATVDQNGKVTAAGAGTATITATTANGLKAVCKVTVTNSATAVTLNKKTATLAKGKTLTLKATVTPADATDNKVTWSSNKPSVATVDAATGKVTAKKAGTATITATTAGGIKATCKITVTVPATKIYIASTATVAVKKTVTLYATVTPSDSTDKITWTSSNKKVATVSNGKVKGVKAGTATITAKTSSGKKVTCKVTVTSATVKATKVTLNKKKISLKKGKTYTLKATVAPKKATTTITWSSSKKSVATVDKNGVVTAKKKGTATITAKTSNGKKATCKVTVK